MSTAWCTCCWRTRWCSLSTSSSASSTSTPTRSTRNTTDSHRQRGERANLHFNKNIESVNRLKRIHSSKHSYTSTLLNNAKTINSHFTLLKLFAVCLRDGTLERSARLKQSQQIRMNLNTSWMNRNESGWIETNPNESGWIETPPEWIGRNQNKNEWIWTHTEWIRICLKASERIRKHLNKSKPIWVNQNQF